MIERVPMDSYVLVRSDSGKRIRHPGETVDFSEATEFPGLPMEWEEVPEEE